MTLLLARVEPKILEGLALVGAPLTAMASVYPCQLYTYHAPVPSRTQGHHRYPMSLQKEVWGEVRLPELLWVCGTCHDNIHEWLSYLLGRARKPSPEPGAYAKREAERAYNWFKGVTA